MIQIYSTEEVAQIREVAKGIFGVHLILSGMVRPGVATSDLAIQAETWIKRLGLKATYKGLRGYPSCITTSINSEVENGIPSGQRQLREGDIVKIGLGANARGLHADKMVTYAVGSISDRAARLMAVANDAMWRAISQCRAENRLSNISHTIQSTAEHEGYSVARALIGHGIGRQHHEEPMIPNFGPPSRGPELRAGMVLKPHVLVFEKAYDMKTLKDGWTCITEDGGLAAGSTEVVAITEQGPDVLTGLLGIAEDPFVQSLLEEIWCKGQGDPVPGIGDLIVGERVEDRKEGGMGAVFLTPVHAFKTLTAGQTSLTFNSRAWQMFANEIRIWLQLPPHENVVRAHTVVPERGRAYLALERVRGGDLMDWIHDGRLYHGSPAQVLTRILAIAIQSARGLDYAHERGVIHQDVKPANILLTVDGTAKVTDFGLARARVAVEETGSAPSRLSELVTWGGRTPAYCSPEQARGEKLTRKTDIWSWATTILTMFTGGVSWASGSVADGALEQYLRVPREDHSGPEMPNLLSDVLLRCLRRDPESRPNGMQTVLSSLLPIYEQIAGHRFSDRDPRDA